MPISPVKNAFLCIFLSQGQATRATKLVFFRRIEFKFLMPCQVLEKNSTSPFLQIFFFFLPAFLFLIFCFFLSSFGELLTPYLIPDLGTNIYLKGKKKYSRSYSRLLKAEFTKFTGEGKRSQITARCQESRRWGKFGLPPFSWDISGCISSWKWWFFILAEGEGENSACWLGKMLPRLHFIYCDSG